MATTISTILLGVAALATIIRIIVGPTLADRVLGLDVLTILGVGFIGAFAVRTGLFLYVDIAVTVALSGLLATLGFARYLLSRPQQ
ncbi:MAG: monovalent cation/H+ antiporter complex subunit F [Devosia sp.]